MVASSPLLGLSVVSAVMLLNPIVLNLGALEAGPSAMSTGIPACEQGEALPDDRCVKPCIGSEPTRLCHGLEDHRIKLNLPRRECASASGCPPPPCNAATPPAPEAIEPAASEGIPAGGLFFGAQGTPPLTPAGFDQMQAANVNFLVVGGQRAVTTNWEILRLAHERGIQVIVQDDRMPEHPLKPQVREEGGPAPAADDLGQRANNQIDGAYAASRFQQGLNVLSASHTASIAQIVQDFAPCQALAGYHVDDEPDGYQQDFYAGVARQFLALDPVHVPFVNFQTRYTVEAFANEMSLFVDGTCTPGLGTEKSPLTTDLPQACTPVISYDYYAFTEDAAGNPTYRNGDAHRFEDALDAASGVAKTHTARGTPLAFWDYVQLTEHTANVGHPEWEANYRQLSEGELRYEAMQSIAFGSQAVIYFLWSAHSAMRPGDHHDFQDDGVLLRDGSLGPHYAELQTIGGEFEKVGRYLAHATHLGTVRDASSVPFGSTLLTVSSGGVNVGVYSMPPGIGPARNYAMLASTDFDAASTVVLSVAGATPEYLDLASSSWQDASGGLPLAAGGGTLVRW